MAFNYDLPAINKLFASDTSNYYIPNETQVGNSILLNSNLQSNVANSLLYKLSSGIQYAQEFGGLNYIPGKKYKIGSIVYLNILINNLNTVVPVMCIKNTTGQQYCDIQPIDDIVKQDTGNVYFTTANIKTEYWQPINTTTMRSGNISFADFNSTAYTTDNQLKFVKLIDFTQYSDFVESTFILTIKRGGNRIDAAIHVHAFAPNTIEVFVNDVLCDNYRFNSSSSIFNPNSKFKDIALLGTFLSINEDKSLYLVVCGRSASASGDVEISYQLKNGNIAPNMSIPSNLSYTFINNLQNTIIPFKGGASNVFNNCGQILTFFSNPTAEYIFRNGLFKLGSTGNVDQFLYPSLQKVTGENNLYEVDNRYLVQDNSSRYISQSLPNIKGFTYLRGDGSSHNSGSVNPTGCFELPPSTNLLTWSATNRYINQNNGIQFNAHASNPIYQDGADVKPKSTQVQYYIKLF